jgi:hypothetical protein
MKLNTGVALGIMLGFIFGVWNVVVSILYPLMDDTPLALLSFYGPMFGAWGFAGYAAYRRARRLRRSAVCGATVALGTFVVLTTVVMLRMNLALDVVSQRPDWRNLVARYEASNFESLRSYANYVYLTGAPFKIGVASAIGAVMGALGGLLGMLTARRVPAET